jgi:hypothetical protein
MPALPFAVFRTSFDPESAESGAAEAVFESDPAEVVAAEDFFASEDEESSELLHAAANVAKAARERLRPTVRSEVL